MEGVVPAVTLREGMPPQQGMLLLTLSWPSPHPSTPFLAPGASRIHAQQHCHQLRGGCTDWARNDEASLSARGISLEGTPGFLSFEGCNQEEGSCPDQLPPSTKPRKGGGAYFAKNLWS